MLVSLTVWVGGLKTTFQNIHIFSNSILFYCTLCIVVALLVLYPLLLLVRPASSLSGSSGTLVCLAVYAGITPTTYHQMFKSLTLCPFLPPPLLFLFSFGCRRCSRACFHVPEASVYNGGAARVSRGRTLKNCSS